MLILFFLILVGCDTASDNEILLNNTNNTKEFWENKFNAKKVASGFSYNSGDNTEWDDVESLRKLIKEHVDGDFNI